MSNQPNKILIVDDEAALRTGLARCMAVAGFETLEAENGKQALSVVEEHSPELVILDVMMHGMTGLEVCRTLKSDPRTNWIKIVFLSARGQVREQEEGMEAGCDYYMTKPFNYLKLISIVKQLLA